MDDIVAHLRNLPGDLFSRFQVEFHTFSSAALKEAKDSSICLQSGFVLSEQDGTGEGCNGCQNQVVFHASGLLPHSIHIGEQII